MDDDLPAGFIPTGGPLDRYLIQLHRFRESPALAKLSYTNLQAVTPNKFARSSVPKYPPLPDIGTSTSGSRPSSIRTGDAVFDEGCLLGWVQQYGTQAEQSAMVVHGRVREANLAARRKLADTQRARVGENAKLLMMHLLAAVDMFFLAAGDDPAALLEVGRMKYVYERLMLEYQKII